MPRESKTEGSERLHKRIAACGVASRRAAEALIREGRVKVNGKLVQEMGVLVTQTDKIEVDGRLVETPKLYTLILNKPTGYVVTMDDPQGRRTVVELLPDLGVTLKPIGRLDKDSEGLLIFTNDGKMHQRLTHPSFGIEKEYLVTVTGEPDEKSLDKLRKGVYIEEGGKTAPAKVERLHFSGSTLKIILHEGRKRQIRLMCEAVGFPVKTLKRVRIGPIIMRDLPRGGCKMLGKVEIDALKKQVGLD